MRARAAMLCVALLGCHDARTEAPPPRGSVRRELLRCTFDDAPGDVAQSDFEALIRRDLRRDRMTFSVRAGRCEGLLEDGAHAEDPAVRTFVGAWNEMLPLAQSPTPDDVELERAIRHVGNAWSALR